MDGLWLSSIVAYANMSEMICLKGVQNGEQNL